MRTPTYDFSTPNPELYNLQRNLPVAFRVVGVTVTPLYYHGALAGSGLDVYDVKKIYIALALHIATGGTGSVAFGTVQTFDEANNLLLTYLNTTPYWDGAALKMFHNAIFIQNIWFSRLAFGTYSHVLFNGYRINRP